MSARDPDSAEALRRMAREVLAEIVPGMVRDAVAEAPAGGRPTTNGHATRDPASVPRVPVAPVAAVLRPSTWSGPAVPGEVIGDGAPAASSAAHEFAAPRAPASAAAHDAAADDPGARVERVTIDTDEDLQRFVRTLANRLENPRERRAIRAGRTRFGLRRTGATGGAPGAPGTRAETGSTPAIRVSKGAVTERAVREAAAAGAGLVLAPGAVLTPLARDQARALRVEIKREGRC